MKGKAIVIILFAILLFNNVEQVNAAEDDFYEGYSQYFDSSMLMYNYDHIGYLYDYSTNWIGTTRIKTYVDIQVYNRLAVKYEGILGTPQFVAENVYSSVFYNYSSTLTSIGNYYSDSLTISTTYGLSLALSVDTLEDQTIPLISVKNVYTSTSSYRGEISIDYSEVSDPLIVMPIYSLHSKVYEKKTVCISTLKWYGFSSYDCTVGSNVPTTYKLGYDHYFASVDLIYDTPSYIITKKQGYSYTEYTGY